MSVYDPNKVSQCGISALGNVVGRDDKSTTTNNYYNYSNNRNFREDPILKKLVSEHEYALEKDINYKEFSDKLNNFLNRKVEKDLRDLSTKLIDGNREYSVIYAMELKEEITKKIVKNSHFETAQKIYTYLLAQIRTIFINQVASRIKSNKFDDFEIDDFIVEKIIEPLLLNVDNCSLMIDKEELYGLLYILTGNCYIEWD